MNIKSFSILTATAITLSTGVANANILFDIYAGATYGIGGYTLFDDNDNFSKSSQSYGAVLGMDIPMFRVELEYNYLDSDALTASLGLVNAYFKLPLPVIKPYIGAGIGYTFDTKYSSIETEDTMAYQGMLGATLNLPVLPFNVDIEGRVLYAPDIMPDIDLLQYEGRIKARYVF